MSRVKKKKKGFRTSDSLRSECNIEPGAIKVRLEVLGHAVLM
jgi:hypothetical protein